MRMTDAHHEASEAARALAQRRWGSTVITRSIQTLVERRAQLDAEQLAALRWVTEERKDAADER